MWVHDPLAHAQLPIKQKLKILFSHVLLIELRCLCNFFFYRYVEAIREFNKILLYIYKTKQYHQKSPQYEQILKKNEQMYALLAICLSLCPQVKLVDETVNSQLREKYGEKMIRMQRYDDEAFAIYDELFSYACPKFITPSAPSFEEPLVNYNQVCTVFGGVHILEKIWICHLSIIFFSFSDPSCYELNFYNRNEDICLTKEVAG